MMRNQKGMSLVELVLALGIFAIITLVLSSLTSTIYKSFSNAGKTATVADTIEVLRTTLMVQKQCTANFAGVPLSGKQMTPTLITKPLSQYKDDDPQDVLLQAGQKLQGVSTIRLQLLPTVQIDRALILAQLQVEFGSEDPKDHQTLTRTIPIYSRVHNGRITECWARQERGSIEANQICIALSQGALDTYDPVTRSCVLGSSEWFEGSFDKASCPKGTFLPRNANGDDNCRAITPPDFVDPFPETPVLMSNGTSIGATRTFVITSLQGSTCRCDWAADLAVQLSKVKCAILCIKP